MGVMKHFLAFFATFLFAAALATNHKLRPGSNPFSTKPSEILLLGLSKNHGDGQNETLPSAAEDTMEATMDNPRTVVAITLLRWFINVFKAMIKPARNLYLMMTPEISAFQCLSESREVQNMLGFGGPYDDFDGYFYESPRSDDGEKVLKRYPRFVDDIASLLKDGKTMTCIMPYMRERVIRWLDS